MQKEHVRNIEKAVYTYSKLFMYSSGTCKKKYAINVGNSEYFFDMDFEEFLTFVGIKSGEEFHELSRVTIANILEDQNKHVDTCKCQSCTKMNTINERLVAFSSFEKVMSCRKMIGFKVPHKEKLVLLATNEVVPGAKPETNTAFYVFKIKKDHKLEVTGIEYSSGSVTNCLTKNDYIDIMSNIVNAQPASIEESKTKQKSL